MYAKKMIYSPLGDSLSKGFGASRLEKTFPYLVSEKIKQNIKYDLILKDGIRDAGRSLKSSALISVNKVIEEKPNIITIEYGTNDLNIKRKSEFSSPVKFYKQLNYLIETLYEHIGNDTIIILVTTWNRWNQKYKWIFSIVYDVVIKIVGKKHNISVADISCVWKNRNDTISVPSDIDMYGNVGDGFHPNDKAYSEIADIIYEKLKECIDVAQ